MLFLVFSFQTSQASDSTLYKLITGKFPVISHEIDVYYTSGFENKAKNLSELFAKAQEYFRQELEVEAAAHGCRDEIAWRTR